MTRRDCHRIAFCRHTSCRIGFIAVYTKPHGIFAWHIGTAGDTALTRRSRKNSRLSAVVLKWSRARKRYERQGVLVEENALEQAEKECLMDEASRTAARLQVDEAVSQIFSESLFWF